MAEFRDYENGVADVLSFIFGPSASVERNVHLPGRLSGVSRQIDILVHGPLGDTPDATIVVECKRGSNAVDGGDLDKFVGTLEDVGADLGFYMTSTGASAGARTRASNARTGIRLEIITIDELRRWQPSGTFRTVHCIPTSHLLRVKRTLQDAGFRVVKDTSFSPAEGETLFATLRHYGARSPRIEDQQNHMNTVARLLRQCGIADPALVSHGTVIEGGDPTQRWLEVAVRGEPTGFKVVAGNQVEADEKLDRLAEVVGFPRQLLTVIPAADWPVEGIFGPAYLSPVNTDKDDAL